MWSSTYSTELSFLNEVFREHHRQSEDKGNLGGLSLMLTMTELALVAVGYGVLYLGFFLEM